MDLPVAPWLARAIPITPKTIAGIARTHATIHVKNRTTDRIPRTREAVARPFDGVTPSRGAGIAGGGGGGGASGGSSIYRSSIGTYVRSRGPTYSDPGRMIRLFAYCSRTCAVHPVMRASAKIGVIRSVGIPSMWYTPAA
jgi:hypothetical protein